MKTQGKMLLAILSVICMVGVTSAHFTMVFPRGDMDVTTEDYIAELGEKKEVLIVWGHPYEHVLFDMTTVPVVSVVDPEGNTAELSVQETEVDGYKAYKTSFTVDKLGDWIIAAEYEDEDESLIDYVKAVIHCGEETWFGWDSDLGQNAEILPYTRPYGVEEGFVFTGKAMYAGEVLADSDVEIEMYHAKDIADGIVEAAEDMYAYDPPMMFTRVVKTNDAGEFTYTLDEPGIWFIGAYGPEEEGILQRGVFIVPVLDAFPAKEEALPSQQEQQQDDDSLLVNVGILISIVAVLIAIFAVKR